MSKEVIVIKADEGSKKRKNNLLRVCAYCRVSTDLDEQLTSYETQINHYTKVIQDNPNYEFVGIYADRGITGTQTKNRDEFNRMIDDAKLGKIDLIIAKSISRFARNTLDTLNYVRLLKEHKVDVYFEKENLHTLSMTSEMLLTLMSAFAQAESESISENVTMGLRARMKSGDYIGSGNRCFGYHIDVKNNIFEIKEDEAKIVRKIFHLYLEGNGYRRIANQLNEENILSPTGIKWRDASVQNILQNEKYCGDVIVQKSYTVDVISHKRLMNYGELPQYHIKDHHEAIICREDWNLVQQIMRERSKSSEYHMHDSKHSRKYTFTSKISCGKCGKNFERQIKKRKKEDVIYWKCHNSYYPLGSTDRCDAFSIRETVLETLFVKIYNFLIKEVNYDGNSIVEIIKDFLIKNSNQDTIDKLHKEYVDTQKKLSNLIEIKIDDLCHKETYELKEIELTSRLNEIQQKLSSFNENEKSLHLLKKRLNEINKVIQSSKEITEFDKDLFEKMVGKILIGDGDNVIRFILNDNLSSSIYIYPTKGVEKNGLFSTDEGCSVENPTHNTNIVDILEFKAKIKDGKIKKFYSSRLNLSNLEDIYTIYVSIKK